MTDLLGRLVEYSTGERDRRDRFIWDVGRVRAVEQIDRARWELLIEEHDGTLITSLHDGVRLIDERRAKELERNRRARRQRRRR